MEGRIEDPSQPQIPRTRVPNPHNYTELQLAERKIAVDDLIRKHPTVPEKWIEWTYDVIVNKDEEEVKDIVNNNLWDKPIKEKRETGGTLVGSCEVLDLGGNVVQTI